MATIYVTGHRNPDTDSIASAIGYAELKGRLHPDDRYVAVRLGPVNAQTAWALERSGAAAPELLPHIHLRVRDVMGPERPCAGHNDSLRAVGLAMAKSDADLIPIVDDDGVLVGVLTARDLARRYIKESGEPSSFDDRPVSVDLIVEVLGGELLRAARAPAHRPPVGRDGAPGHHGPHHGRQRHRGHRRPRRRPAAGGRDRRRAGGDDLRRAARTRSCCAWRGRRAPASSSRPSTRT